LTVDDWQTSCYGANMNTTSTHPNKFDEWMSAKGIPNATMAKMLGCNPSVVWRWRKGKRTPSVKYAYEIQRLTKGEVKITSWIKPEQADTREG